MQEKVRYSTRGRVINPASTAHLITHGGFKYHYRTYRCWIDMKARCFNQGNADFHDYGGRGISICARWMKFENFFSDMGDRPEGMSIDRISNDSDYGPENCRWATQIEQQNNRRDCVFLTHNGKTQTVTQWARELGLSRAGLDARLKRGLPLNEVLTSKRYSKWSH